MSSQTMTTVHSGAGRPTGERTLFGHPMGLYVLFFTEMWERFSYYGMRALLTLYMVNYLFKKDLSHVIGLSELRHFFEWMYGPLGDQPFASSLYGTYTGLVYLTPIFGGMIADKYWGQRKTVVVGGIAMAIGHFLMAFENFFLWALLCIIIGNGLFKPNLSTQVGALYPQGDVRRDGAYTIYYMGINLGALFSPLVCGTLGQKYGWHYGFSAAGIGMVVGLALYLWGQRLLAPDDLTLRKAEGHPERQPLNTNEWKAVGALVLLCMLNIVFWGVYEQQGNTLQIFADNNADWHVFGWEMPSTWFQSINPLFILLLGPVLEMIWGFQSRRGIGQSSVTKMAIGCAVLGLGFMVMIPLSMGLGEHDRISFWWLMLAGFVYTVGELYLSPIGLSLVTKVSPARIVGMMMGMWFLSSFFGNFLSGYLGMFYSSMTKSGFFLMLGVLAVIAGAAIFMFNRPLKKVIGDV